MTEQPIVSETAPGKRAEWHSQPAASVLRKLSSTVDGLSSADAARRLIEVGPNELAFARTTPWWRMLLRQFFSPLIAILLVAAVVTLIQQHYVDSVAIFLILALNAGLGFAQERKAESDVLALQSLSTPTCRVLRDGVERVIAGRDVVPGDILLLESGERVAADLRLLEANGLHGAAMTWPVSAGILGFTALSAAEWLLCIAVGSTVLIIVEAEKAVRRWSRR